jgi:hypothetical protein
MTIQAEIPARPASFPPTRSTSAVLRVGIRLGELFECYAIRSIPRSRAPYNEPTMFTSS